MPSLRDPARHRRLLRSEGVPPSIRREAPFPHAMDVRLGTASLHVRALAGRGGSSHPRGFRQISFLPQFTTNDFN